MLGRESKDEAQSRAKKRKANTLSSKIIPSGWDSSAVRSFICNRAEGSGLLEAAPTSADLWTQVKDDLSHDGAMKAIKRIRNQVANRSKLSFTSIAREVLERPEIGLSDRTDKGEIVKAILVQAGYTVPRRENQERRADFKLKFDLPMPRFRGSDQQLPPSIDLGKFQMVNGVTCLVRDVNRLLQQKLEELAKKGAFRNEVWDLKKIVVRLFFWLDGGTKKRKAGILGAVQIVFDAQIFNPDFHALVEEPLIHQLCLRAPENIDNVTALEIMRQKLWEIGCQQKLVLQWGGKELEIERRLLGWIVDFKILWLIIGNSASANSTLPCPFSDCEKSNLPGPSSSTITKFPAQIIDDLKRNDKSHGIARKAGMFMVVSITNGVEKKGLLYCRPLFQVLHASKQLGKRTRDLIFANITAKEQKQVQQREAAALNSTGSLESTNATTRNYRQVARRHRITYFSSLKGSSLRHLRELIYLYDRFNFLGYAPPVPDCPGSRDEQAAHRRNEELRRFVEAVPVFYLLGRIPFWSDGKNSIYEHVFSSGHAAQCLRYGVAPLSFSGEACEARFKIVSRLLDLTSGRISDDLEETIIRKMEMEAVVKALHTRSKPIHHVAEHGSPADVAIPWEYVLAQSKGTLLWDPTFVSTIVSFADLHSFFVTDFGYCRFRFLAATGTPNGSEGLLTMEQGDERVAKMQQHIENPTLHACPEDFASRLDVAAVVGVLNQALEMIQKEIQDDHQRHVEIRKIPEDGRVEMQADTTFVFCTRVDPQDFLSKLNRFFSRPPSALRSCISCQTIEIEVDEDDEPQTQEVGGGSASSQQAGPTPVSSVPPRLPTPQIPLPIPFTPQSAALLSFFSTQYLAKSEAFFRMVTQQNATVNNRSQTQPNAK